MKKAILFWFYQSPGICKNHLEIIRRYNPGIAIYGLYGGAVDEYLEYQSLLSDYLDDFYVFDQPKSSSWKWHLGDLLITDWYTQRGKNLDWDTIIIVQWDMLIFGSIDELFAGLAKDEILLSGLRPVQEVEDAWGWTSATINPNNREQYLNFLNYVRNKYNYSQEPLCCLFIVVCLPKSFLDKYAVSVIEEAELGFLEYRVPIYAQIFGTPFFTNHNFNPYWEVLPTSTNNMKTLNAKRIDVGILTIINNLLKSDGVKVFHPYRKIFPFYKWQYPSIFPILIREVLEKMYRGMKVLRYGTKY